MRLKFMALAGAIIIGAAGVAQAQTVAPTQPASPDLSKVIADFSDFSDALALANSAQARLRADLGPLVQGMNGQVASLQSAMKTKDSRINQLQHQVQADQQQMNALRAAQTHPPAPDLARPAPHPIPHRTAIPLPRVSHPGSIGKTPVK